MTRRAFTFALSLALIVLALADAAPCAAQTKEAHPQALQAFEKLLAAWRTFPSVEVQTTVAVEMMDGDVKASGDETKGEFVFGPGQSAVVKLRGFTVHLHTEKDADAGIVAAVHEGNEASYFTTTDDGSPYYALLNSFVDLPFPELALRLGFESVEDVLMQLHPKEPWLQPTAVEAAEVDGRSLQKLTLESDFSKMTMLVDPETQLLISGTLEIGGGDLVREGTSLVYRYTWDCKRHEQPLDVSTFKLEPGQRQRVDLMAALLPEPARPDEAGEGGAHGALAGKPAPPITLATADGKAFDLADMKGRVVVLDFWASWCGPCMQGLPVLHEIAKWTAEEQMPVTFMTINCWEIRTSDTDTPDARLASARNTWEAKGFTLPIAMDYSDETAVAYGVRGIPTTVIIRSDGVVHTVHEGAAESDVLRTAITEALRAVEPGM